MTPRPFRTLRRTFSALFGRGRESAHWGQRYGRWLVLLALIFAALVLISPYFYVRELRFRQGEIVQQPVLSQIQFTYDDPYELNKWLDRRNREFKRVYRYDSREEERALGRLAAFFREMRKAQLLDEDLYSTATAVRIAIRLRQNSSEPGEPLGLSLNDETLLTLLKYREVPSFEQDIAEILRAAYRTGIVSNAAKFRSDSRNMIWTLASNPPVEPVQPTQILDYPEGIHRYLLKVCRAYFEKLPARPGESPREAAIQLLTQLIRPNVFFDEDASRRERDRYMEGREETRRHIGPGEELLASGQTITERERTLVGLYNSSLRNFLAFRLIGDTAFILLATAILGFYVFKLGANFRFDIHNTLLVGLPVIIALAIERLLLVVTAGSEVSTDLAGFAFPAAAIGMLGVLLLDVRLALILATWGGLLFGLQANLALEYVVVALLGAYAAVGALHSIRERREVITAGLRIAIINALGILVILFIKDPAFFLSDVLGMPFRLAAVGVINGIVCPLITIALLPLFEMLFGVVTDMRLLELTGLDHPLTRQIEKEAPGTWQHTLNVAKLAEAAAQAVGVNPLLVRAGAYFHDIGKVRKPPYFTENQALAEDKRRHQELRPQMSVLIIRDHVKSGMEMARDAGLPEKIIDFIPQHHGTSLIKFFYYKALKQFEEGKTKAPVREEDYRYPGPKPQSRETAIVMLADSVEAIATAKLTGAQIREEDIYKMVRDAVLDKFNDGQFDECDMTLRDLQRIREAFIDQLISRFHTRIDYPKLPEKREPGAAGGMVAASAGIGAGATSGAAGTAGASSGAAGGQKPDASGLSRALSGRTEPPVR